tara:strand:- start:9547 stop:10404 length:858 start_codon:yes stop_codon:yes gene_type:complete
MARKRMIDPKFWTDDKIMDLDPLTRLLFIGIWNFADDAGVHLNNSKVLKAEIFPCDDISIDEVQKMKDQLNDLGMIKISEDRKLFKIRNWTIYQKINRPQPSKYKFNDDSVIDQAPIIPKGIERNIIEDNKIKDNNTVKKSRKKKTSSLKPYKERVEEFYKNLDSDLMDLWKEAYPNIDINKELVKAKTWLLINTQKAKKDFKRFTNNWLSSAMENAGRYNTQSSQDHMIKLKEEKIQRDMIRQRKEWDEGKKNAASPEEISSILKGITKKLTNKGEKDVESNED